MYESVGLLLLWVSGLPFEPLESGVSLQSNVKRTESPGSVLSLLPEHCKFSKSVTRV